MNVAFPTEKEKLGLKSKNIRTRSPLKIGQNIRRIKWEKMIEFQRYDVHILLKHCLSWAKIILRIQKFWNISFQTQVTGLQPGVLCRHVIWNCESRR